MVKKVSRESESRESKSRKRSWQPPSALGTPPKIEGYTYKWVRLELRGDSDDANVVRRTHEGYEPVRKEELPEGYITEVVDGGKHTGVVRSGDLILCKMPDEMVAQRNEHYNSKTRRQADAVNVELQKHQSSLMPISNESSTKTTRGGAAFQK